MDIHNPIAPRVYEAEERLRRTKRLANGDNGARLIEEMETLLREYMAQEGPCPSCKKVRPALLHNGALPRGWHAEECRLGLLVERIDAAPKR